MNNEVFASLAAIRTEALDRGGGELDQGWENLQLLFSNEPYPILVVCFIWNKLPPVYHFPTAEVDMSFSIFINCSNILEWFYKVAVNS